MPAAGAHLARHFRVAMQCIAGHDAAFERDGIQRRRSGRHLVSGSTCARRERQTGFGIPDADHQRRHVGPAALIAVAQAVAVHGDHIPGRAQAETVPQSSAETTQCIFQLVGTQQTKHAADGVLAGRGIGRKIHKLDEVRSVRRSEVSDVHAASRPHSVAASEMNSSAAS